MSVPVSYKQCMSVPVSYKVYKCTSFI